MEEMRLELTQEPIIKYNALDLIARDIERRIEEADLDNIEVTEENYKEIKTTRTSLSKEFKVLEEKRKLIKDMVMKPYNEFEVKYKSISTQYKNADEVLKIKINSVEQSLLDQKVEGLKKYFDEINKFEFIKFEDMELKITRSTSDKSLKEAISAYLDKVKDDITTIKTQDNKDRVFAKYQICKNLNKSISEVAQEIKLEEEIDKTQKGLANKAVTEQKETDEYNCIRKEKTKREEPEKIEKQNQRKETVILEFYEDIERFKFLKQFLEREGFNYEQIK